MASRYIVGCDALAVRYDKRSVDRALGRARPLSAAEGQSLLACGIIGLEARPQLSAEHEEILRQLRNMVASISRAEVKTIPDDAADVLSDAVEEAAVACAESVSFTPSVVETGGHTSKDFTDILGALAPRVHGDDDEFGEEGERYDIIGMFDILTEQDKMNGLKPVTVTIARTLVKHGQSTIAQAIKQAKQPWYKPDLPGDTARNNVAAHLQWHVNAIAKVGGNPDTTPYPSGDDLKKWTMQAFIEANAVEEGAQWMADAWEQMWIEIRDGLARAPGKIVEAVTGIPWWLVYTGGAVLVGLVGYGAYKILAGPAGGAVVRHYLR